MKKNNEKRAGAERLFDAVTEIDHDLVDGSRPGKTGKTAAKTKKRLIAALVAAAVALGAVAGVALRETRSQGAEKPDPAETGSLTPPEERDRFNPFVVSAEYPVYDSEEENREAVKIASAQVSDKTREGLVKLAKGLLSNAEGASDVVSPASIYLALGMLSEVSAGEQLASFFGFSDKDELRPQLAALWDSFYLDGESSKSSVGASLWLDNSAEYNMDLLRSVSVSSRASVFSGEFGTEEFDDQLKEWLNGQTGGLLADKMENVKSYPSTALAVVTSVYRKAEWFAQFNEKENTTAVFHGTDRDEECTFMNHTIMARAVECDGFDLAGLPLKDGSCMWFALPDEGGDTGFVVSSDELWDTIANWGKEESERIMSRFRDSITISLPKFDVSVEKDIVKDLYALGITDIFDGVADFSPLFANGSGEEEYVSRMDHGVRVTVNESGVEAAGYTGAYLDGFGDAFVLDRPFVFVMTNPAGLPLFAGVVNQIG